MHRCYGVTLPYDVGLCDLNLPQYILYFLCTKNILMHQKKHLGSKPKQVTELGTQNKGDIDYDWLPKEALQELSEQSYFLHLLHQTPIE